MILRQKTKRTSVSAVKKKTEAQSDFLSQFLTTHEIHYCRSKRHFAESAAARIAAKQACLSLLEIPSTQAKDWFLDIEIQRESTGKPFLELSAQLKKRAKLLKGQSLILSLAHERELAIAWVALADGM